VESGSVDEGAGEAAGRGADAAKIVVAEAEADEIPTARPMSGTVPGSSLLSF